MTVVYYIKLYDVPNLGRRAQILLFFCYEWKMTMTSKYVLMTTIDHVTIVISHPTIIALCDRRRALLPSSKRLHKTMEHHHF